MSDPSRLKQDLRVPMRVVTRATGLSADVIRAWERRYGAIDPDRTEGKARRYSAAEVERLIKLRDAVALGHAIGDVARLPEGLLAELVSSRSLQNRPAGFIDGYLALISKLDLAGAEALLARESQLRSMRDFVVLVAAPLLHEVGERWHRGVLTIASEHAVSAQLRALLQAWLRTATSAPGAKRIVFSTPPTYTHELGALMAAVLAAGKGARILYLGADMPLEELEVARSEAGASLIVLSVIPGQDRAALERKALLRLASGGDVWLGAPAEVGFAPMAGVRIFSDWLEYELALEHWLAQST
jgi:MerR family transcriptional regulator, light-induced transcriptional regulator